MNKLLDFISSICPITGDSLIDTIIFAAIAAIAFWTAWKLTGFVAGIFGLYDSKLMSIFHCIVHLVVFFGLLMIAIGLVRCVL